MDRGYGCTGIRRCGDREFDDIGLIFQVKDQDGAILALQVHNASEFGRRCARILQPQRLAILALGLQVALGQKRNAAKPAGEVFVVQAARHGVLGCRKGGHSALPVDGGLAGPLQPHGGAGCAPSLYVTAWAAHALDVRLRRTSQSPRATANATAMPTTMAMYVRLTASRSQSSPINPPTDKPEITGTRRGRAQHAAQAPARPMVVRRGFSIVFSLK